MLQSHTLTKMNYACTRILCSALWIQLQWQWQTIQLLKYSFTLCYTLCYTHLHTADRRKMPPRETLNAAVHEKTATPQWRSSKNIFKANTHINIIIKKQIYKFQVKLVEQFTQTLKPSCLWPLLLCCLQKNKPKWKFLSVGVYLMLHYHSFQTSSWPLVKCGLSGNFHLETGCLPVNWGPLPWQHEQRLHWRSEDGPLLFSTRYCNYPLIIILLLLLLLLLIIFFLLWKMLMALMC